MTQFNKQILEAVNKGINLALDNFDDQEDNIQQQTHGKVKTNNTTKEYLNLVDFNLPSGNLWYKHNLGAINPTCWSVWPHQWWGNFYAWGEIKTKREYNQANYKFIIQTYLKNTVMTEYTKYCHNINDGYKGYKDNLRQLQPEDDVAHIELGTNYWIPTKEDFEELFQYTKQHYTKNFCGIRDLNGVIFTSIDDDKTTMFIPCAGLKCAINTWNPNGDSGIGFELHLWTSTFNTNVTSRAVSIEGKQHEFEGGWGKCHITNDNYKCYGLPIRPVYKLKANHN